MVGLNSTPMNVGLNPTFWPHCPQNFTHLAPKMRIIVYVTVYYILYNVLLCITSFPLLIQ